MTTKVLLKKKYKKEGVLEHIILLGITTCNFKNFSGENVFGTVIGVSIVDKRTSLILRDEKGCLYNRNKNEIQLNGDYKKIEGV